MESRRSPARRARIVAAHRAEWEQRGIPYGLCLCGCGESTPIFAASDFRQRAIQGEHYRFVRQHHLPLSHREYEERSCGYTSPCWVWLRSYKRNGYGQGPAGCVAHRLIYERLRGPVAAGMDLDHLCRNRRCVNPDHLEVVTRAVNAQRGAIAKLDWDKVREIRSSPESDCELARRFGVRATTVWAARHHRTWKEPTA